MSARRAEYPHRPTRRSRPKASENSSKKKKTWTSDRSVVKGNIDVSPRGNDPWWKAPMYKEARMKKWQ